MPGNTYDPDLMHGWVKRAYNWEFSTGVQHEVMTRTSVDVSYFRRVYGNFRVTDNRNLGPADFDKFDVDGARRIRVCRAAAATSSTACTT